MASKPMPPKMDEENARVCVYSVPKPERVI
jgi:hypothetical protein